jgi:shikimate kinase
MTLRKIEEEVLLRIDCHNYVIATGGSAVYSRAAMSKLKLSGVVVFLDVDLNTLKTRVHDFGTRGLSKSSTQNLADLFKERFILYAKYADVTVTCADLSQEEVCSEIVKQLPASLAIPQNKY